MLSTGKNLDGGIKAKIVLRKRLGRDPTPQETAIALRSNKKFHASTDEIFQECGEGRAVCSPSLSFRAKYNHRSLAGLRMVHEVRRLRCGFSAKDCSRVLKLRLVCFLVDV